LSLRKAGFETALENIELTPDKPQILRVKMEPKD
jgi:hypothetical protein